MVNVKNKDNDQMECELYYKSFIISFIHEFFPKFTNACVQRNQFSEIYIYRN